MEQIYEISMLLDFYGQLLTKRQYEILDLHYNNDYSLGEISELLGISRQGVHDTVKRAKASLYNLEKKLGLVKRFSEQKAKTSKLYGYFKQIERESLDPANRDLLEKIENCLIDIAKSM